MAKIASMLPKLGGQPKQSTSGKGWDETKEIEKLAYQFFIERGCQHGHDQEDWAKAESIIRSRKS